MEYQNEENTLLYDDDGNVIQQQEYYGDSYTEGDYEGYYEGYNNEGYNYEDPQNQYWEGEEYEEVPTFSEEEILEIQNFSAVTIQSIVRLHLAKKFYKDLYAKRSWTLIKADIITEHATKARAKGPGSRRPPTRGKRVVGLTEPTYPNNNSSLILPSTSDIPSENNEESPTNKVNTISGIGMSSFDLQSVKLKKTPVLSRRKPNDDSDLSILDKSPEPITNHLPPVSSTPSRGRTVRPISVAGLSPIQSKTPSSPLMPSTFSKPIEASSSNPLPPPTIPTPQTSSQLHSSPIKPSPPPPPQTPSPPPIAPHPLLNTTPSTPNNTLPPPSFPPPFSTNSPVNRRDIKSMAPTTSSALNLNSPLPPPPASFSSPANFPPPPPTFSSPLPPPPASFSSPANFPPPPSALLNHNNNHHHNNTIEHSNNNHHHHEHSADSSNITKSNSNYIPPPVIIDKPDKKELHRRNVVRNVLSNFLAKRPTREAVIEKGILKSDDNVQLAPQNSAGEIRKVSSNANAPSSNITSLPAVEELPPSPSTPGTKVCTNIRCQKKLKSVSKNQCKMCQRLFCKICMNKKIKLPELKINKAVSVCDTCFHLKRAIAFEKEKSVKIDEFH